MRAADSRPRRVLRDALNCENGKSAAPVAGFDAIEARRKSPKPPDTKVKERRIAIVSADVRAREAKSTSDHLPLEAAPAESSDRSLEAGEAPVGPAMRLA